MSKTLILDHAGQPMRRAGSYADNATPYAGGDPASQELASWQPQLGSPDSDYNSSRDTIVARTRDVNRNSGWGKSALDRQVDNVIGSGWRLSCKPDYEALGLSKEWADSFAKQVEGRWRLFAEDPEFYVDASRNDTFNGLLRIGYKQRFRDGEALAIALWLDNKPNGRYATTIQIVDTDRLSNPNELPDSDRLRAGIEIDDYGAPVAYHFRRAHKADARLSYGKAYQWERVAKELRLTLRGRTVTRQQVIHSYEKDRPNQHRGVSAFVAVLERMKMVDKYDRIELQAAVLNAVLAAYIESHMDHEFLMEALEGQELSKYQQSRAEFHKDRSLKLNGVRIPTLFPGEKIQTIMPSRPATGFEAFERACLRNIAAGLGMSYEQLTQDWSQVNYSSARAALQEIWKSMSSSREDFATKFATPIFLLWLQEAVYRGDIDLPAGAPDFETAKAAYGRCEWIGMGRGYVDPEKEASASNMRMNNLTSTLEKECAEQGLDWREVLAQRAREKSELLRLGLALPDWAAGPSDRQVTRRQQEGNVE